MKESAHNDLLTLPDRIPHFFILGGPKCGTTSLFFWLQQHPDTFLPHKEPNFLSRDIFDARDVPGAMKDWSEYLARLMPPEQQRKITGESTPRYFYSDLALDILCRHPSQPRLIVILRNPIDLVYSLHGQMVREGVETETDFSRAWARSLAAQSEPGAWHSVKGRVDCRLDYPMFGRIGTRLQALQGVVGQGQLRILILEEGLTHTPDTVFLDVLDFLGLSPARIDTERRNERVELRSANLNKRLIALRNAIRRFKAARGMDVRRSRGTGLMKLATKFNTRSPEPHNRLSNGLRMELAEFFQEEVVMVEEVLGRPLTGWQDWQTTSGKFDG
ncbi:MAG: hypothetical protein ACJA09_000907 [Alcanivorax sp.]|jgi:hypothetical protein